MVNPVADWSEVRLWLTLGALALAAIGGMRWIVENDGPLLAAGVRESAALEWVRQPEVADAIVGDYERAGQTGRVVRGVLIDSFVFVPAYSALLAIACFFAARALPPAWSTSALIVGYGAFVAGALDLVENAGILLEVTRRWTFAAPITNLVCLGKWTLAGWSALFALGSAAYAIVRALSSRT
jgi:hypothetical protein